MTHMTIPRGIKLLLLYVELIILLALMAILHINYGNALSGHIIKSLLLISMFILVSYMLIFIISVFYVAKCSQNPKTYSKSYFNKQGDIRNTITFFNRCRNIAYCLTYMEYPKKDKTNTSHPQNDSHNQQKPFH